MSALRASGSSERSPLRIGSTWLAGPSLPSAWRAAPQADEYIRSFHDRTGRLYLRAVPARMVTASDLVELDEILQRGDRG